MSKTKKGINDREAIDNRGAFQTEGGGIRLLKKGRYGVLRVIFSRAGIMLAMILIQIAFLVFVFLSFDKYLPYIYGLAVLLLSVMMVYLLNSGGDPSSKITWLVITIIVPVFGVLLYWYTKSELGHIELANRVSKIEKRTCKVIPRKEDGFAHLEEYDSGAARLAEYLYRVGGFSCYENTNVTYFPLGERMFEALIFELENAKSFIFMEYFSIEEGFFWGNILELLIRKASEGVDVRVLCDGTSELTTLSPSYAKKLKAHGIKCKMFNPITPFLSTYYNYRDHRKITVIDGHTAFNGGINLADEYINRKVRFGHWKDAAVMLKGEAVRSFTLMFQRMWWLDDRKAGMDDDMRKYLYGEILPMNGSGFVVPYSDRPLDGDKVGERVYEDILNRATRYVKIMTPYLILDYEMESALKFAAERGVEVTVMLPGIPDKKLPYALAKTHYKSLLASGVRIFEYSPGFVHAKVFISDDREAVVGTINLDYRSFYHHFECATYMHSVSCISDMKADYDETLKKCKEVTPETVKKTKLGVKLAGALMKAIAPLM